jgi:GTPase SAR1 family protein
MSQGFFIVSGLVFLLSHYYSCLVSMVVTRKALAIFLMGPTASGKTDLAVSLCQRLLEINSAMANFHTHLSLAGIGSGLLASATIAAGLSTISEGIVLWLTGTLGGLLPDVTGQKAAANAG